MKSACRYIPAFLGVLALLVAVSGPVQGGDLKDFEVALAKGQYEIGERNYEAAVEQLEQAYAIRPKDRMVRLTLGIACSRLERYERAKELLEQVAAEDPGNARARYELGVVLAHLKQWGEANRLLATVSAASDSGELADAAQELMEDLQPRKKEGGPTLKVVGGMQYDSNVILEPDAPVQPGEKKSDWRGIVSVLGGYPFLRTGPWSAEASYRFYQSLHLELEDYNVQQHDLGLGGSYKMTDDVKTGMNYSYVQSSVSSDKYSVQHRFVPALDIAAGEHHRIGVYGRWEKKTYFESADLPGNAGRSASSLAGGARYVHLFTKDTNVAAEYAFERDAARASEWDARKNRGAVTGRSRFGKYAVFGSLSLADVRYGPSPVSFYPDRHDRRWDTTVGLFRDIAKGLRVSLANQYVVNDSNLGAYEYRRNIAGLFLEMRL